MEREIYFETTSQLYCDLDGVLADFELGISNKFKKPISELNEGIMWSVLRKSSTFYENLPWMPEGKELWERIKVFNPIILTGCPYAFPSAVTQKQKWCERELGPDVKVITCRTKDKPNYCKKGDILIDDRDIIMEQWIANEGKYILYSEGKLESIIKEIERKMSCFPNA